MIGQVIGNYRVVRQLGEGGMGAVYEAEHPIIGRRVALKVLHRELCDNREVVERFFSEARVVNAIGHEHIVEVSDLGQTAEGLYYLTMEMLDGETLVARMQRERPLDLRFALALAGTVADALGAAHAKGVVHRDVKPENVFLARRGERTDFVKVLDFGIAKLTGGNVKVSYRTRTGSAIGTPYYMSPEQCAGARDIDHRSDVYSLGVVIFEMVTGRVPFDVEGLGLMFMKHMQELPPRPRSLRPDLPEEIEAAILRALAKRPDERFQTMAELRAALEGARIVPATTLGWGPAGAAPGSTPPPEARVTTFSRTVGEVLDDEADDEPLLRPRVGRWLAAGGGALALAVVAAMVVGKARSAPPAAVAPAAPVQAVVAPAKPPAPAAPPVVPAAPATFEVSIASEPPGAEVFRIGETAPVGVTPFALRVSPGRLALRFRKPGFEERKQEIDVSSDTVTRAALAPEPAPTPQPTVRTTARRPRPPAPRDEPLPIKPAPSPQDFVDDL